MADERLPLNEIVSSLRQGQKYFRAFRDADQIITAVSEAAEQRDGLTRDLATLTARAAVERDAALAGQAELAQQTAAAERAKAAAEADLAEAQDRSRRGIEKADADLAAKLRETEAAHRTRLNELGQQEIRQRDAQETERAKHEQAVAALQEEERALKERIERLRTEGRALAESFRG